MYITPVSPEPTWLASRMRCASPPESDLGAAIEREVVEPHVDEEAQSLGHVLHDLRRDFAAPAGDVQAAEDTRARGPR